MRIIEPIAFTCRTIVQSPFRFLLLFLFVSGAEWIEPMLQMYFTDRNSLRTYPYIKPFGGIFWAIGILASLNFFAARFRGESTRFVDDIRRAQGAFWSTGFYALTVLVLFFAGFCAFVLPMFWVLAVFSLAVPAALFVRDPNHNPLRLSRELVRGNFWPVLAVVLISLFSLVIPWMTDRLPYPHQIRRLADAVLTGLFDTASLGLYVGMFYLLWAEKEQAGQLPTATGSRISGWPAALGCLGLIVVLAMGSYGYVWIYQRSMTVPVLRSFWDLVYPPSRAVVAYGYEVQRPPEASFRQSNPYMLRFWYPDHEYLTHVTFTATETEYQPKQFQNRPLNASYFKEYVTEVLLRQEAGNRAENFSVEESLTVGDFTWTVLSFRTLDRIPRVWIYYLTPIGTDRFLCATLSHSSDVKEMSVLQGELKNIKSLLATLKNVGMRTLWQRSDEMEPLVRPGERVFLQPYGENEEPRRGDVVGYYTRINRQEQFLLRVAKLPGETYEEYGRTHTVPPNTYRLSADNPFTDQHKHHIGPVDRHRILGYATDVYYPARRARKIPGRAPLSPPSQ